MKLTDGALWFELQKSVMGVDSSKCDVDNIWINGSMYFIYKPRDTNVWYIHYKGSCYMFPNCLHRWVRGRSFTTDFEIPKDTRFLKKRAKARIREIANGTTR